MVLRFFFLEARQASGSLIELLIQSTSSAGMRSYQIGETARPRQMPQKDDARRLLVTDD